MSTADPNDGMTDKERADIVRGRFASNDSDIRFKDDAGNILTHEQVRQMQAQAAADQAQADEMEADQREQAEARKGRR